MNARQAKRMVEESKKNKRKLMIHFNQRYTPESKIVKQAVEQGNLGEIYYIKTGWLRQMGAPERPSFTDKSFSGGGPLIDLGVHRLDFVLWLLDYPKALTVSAGVFDKIAGDRLRMKGMKYDVEDLGVAMIRLDSGAVLMLEASWATMIKCKEEMNTMVFGTKGSFEQKNIDYKVVEFKFINETKNQIVEVSPKIKKNGGSAQQHFVDCILDDKAPEVSAEHGLQIMKILDAIYKSSRLGREVKIT
jgi:predicted dehydrogenase